MFYTMKSFLYHRKFIARVNKYKLYNNKPLSVTLFITAFNKVSTIISSNLQTIRFNYAYDVAIFTEISDLRQIKYAYLKILIRKG